MAGILPALQGLLKPPVPVGGVVEHQIHDDGDAPLFCLPDESLHILHGAEGRPDRPVIRDVIPVIHLGGVADRREPYAVDPQLFQVVQLLNDAPDIPDAVAVGIQKALGINLIEYG